MSNTAPPPNAPIALVLSLVLGIGCAVVAACLIRHRIRMRAHHDGADPQRCPTGEAA
eukprot:gene9930-46951_t